MSAPKKRVLPVGLDREESNRKKTASYNANSVVTVKIQLASVEGEQDDDEEFGDEAEGEYVDSEDQNEDGIPFDKIGSGGDYDCARNGHAKVFLDGNEIGSIGFTMINRDAGESFHAVCDAESSELEKISGTFFKDDGSLKRSFLRLLSDPSDLATANFFCFLYIKRVKLKSPFHSHCADENVRVAATALVKLIDSTVLNSSEFNTSLTMYIPDGYDHQRQAHSPHFEALDQRAYLQAGFRVLEDPGNRCKYMFRESDVLPV
jgi:hypothetical protein